MNFDRFFKDIPTIDFIKIRQVGAESKNAEDLVVASKETRREVNADKTKYMVIVE